MAESDALIPYPSSREIVIRHKDSIVVFNPASQQLVSKNAPPADVELKECPYCHRPLREDEESSRGRHGSPIATATASFASPEYFRMLQNSLPASTQTSRTTSPHKRIQSGVATPPPIRPPPNAEFVASSPAPGPRHGISSAAFSKDYFNNFFIEEKELGRGNKGVVLLVKHVLDGVSLGHFALKRIPVGDDHTWLEKVLIEVQLLQNLSHQNLVSYRHVWLEEMQITTFGPSVPCAFILQQYCNAGDLQNYILGGMQGMPSKEQLKQRIRRKSRGAPEISLDTAGPRKLQFEEIYAFFKDIASGLNHLHVHNYIHRDLKPNNCLLHQNGKELRVLVSDFGEVQSEDQVRQSTGATGTISYCSPEVLRRDPRTGRFGNFTTKSDIFSLGMILYFLCFAKLPYRNANSINEEQEDIDLLREEIVSWIGVGDLKIARPDLPDKLYVFLNRLLSLDPTNRPAAEEILQAIKTGSGLSEADKRTPGGTEDLRNESRISRIDTPPPPMASRRSSTALSRMARTQPPSKLQLQPASDGTAVENEGDEPPKSATSLVLHRHTPSSLSPTVSATPQAWYHLMFHLSFHEQTLRSIKVVLFIIKLASLYLICFPGAVKPQITMSLLAAATGDLLISYLGLTTSLALLAVHVIVVWVFHNRGSMCATIIPPLPQDWDLNGI